MFFLAKHIIDLKSLTLLLIFLFACCGSVYADEYSDENDRADIITKVNNDKQLIVINDKSYSMLIGLKVYIFEGKTRKKEQVNRYALKVGDSVYFTPETRNRKSYVSEITILR
ncbi:hypothetical protein ACVBE9_07385 [Eionea flava]